MSAIAKQAAMFLHELLMVAFTQVVAADPVALPQLCFHCHRWTPEMEVEDADHPWDLSRSYFAPEQEADHVGLERS